MIDKDLEMVKEMTISQLKELSIENNGGMSKEDCWKRAEEIILSLIKEVRAEVIEEVAEIAMKPFGTKPRYGLSEPIQKDIAEAIIKLGEK